LKAKANAHVRRDKKRGYSGCTVAQYKQQIRAAVAAGGDKDYYTGEVLDWCRASTYENLASREGKVKYKKTFALLPTVDHALNDNGNLKFVICSWRVNDAKSDLTEDEFCELCALVLKYRHEKRLKIGGEIQDQSD
jgi:hypothetical protein